MPRICGRQTHRGNAVVSNPCGVQTVEQHTKDYFRVNVAIPFVEDVIGELQARYVASIVFFC